ncbi:hypothetical protein LUZ60_012984 [Juncus effusus]|nr:hypothetical protein LUZ60_012984 [Juncus effusus]
MKRGRDFNINMAQVLMILSQTGTQSNIIQHYPSQNEERVFECKTCNRQFPSFQALGGHRASHKKPRLSPDGQTELTNSNGASIKPKLHECSICGLEFVVGQALGGHMRRHRQMAATTENFGAVHNGILEIKKNGENIKGEFGLMDLEGEIECKKDRELVTLNLFL